MVNSNFVNSSDVLRLSSMSDRTMSVIEESLLKVSKAQHSVLSESKTKIGDKVFTLSEFTVY